MAHSFNMVLKVSRDHLEQPLSSSLEVEWDFDGDLLEFDKKDNPIPKVEEQEALSALRLERALRLKVPKGALSLKGSKEALRLKVSK
ncbi:hypothetical protein GH714_009155 [Hevea brasiliensis]|uniref:Uncharacterized protein n=1 Tax=Hevea brasiliensis TaxID=3981 RepID=A0A6A6MSV3_HEVBR|nr:hypothetical protein GH714_009155 [Hevea brasiliensis]